MTLFSRNNAYRNLRTLSLMALLPLLAAFAPTTQAAPSSVQTSQTPGFYRMALGDMVVTAIYDGYVSLNPSILNGASASDIQRLLAKMFVETTPGIQTAVNSFLIHADDTLILVDTGGAACLGNSLGRLATNIRAAGYEPDQVDAVLLTHLHPDHVCGLLNTDGSPLFTNANVYASIQETNYWLNPDVVAKAAPEAQIFFEEARAARAPRSLSTSTWTASSPLPRAKSFFAMRFATNFG